MRARHIVMRILTATWLTGGVIMAQDATWVEKDGAVYGAKADERGPIGGGAGYTDIVTGGDVQVATVDELVQALGQATSGQTVFIPGNLELDLTTRVYVDGLVIEVPEGVTLASDRGHNESPGALLTNDTLNAKAMIRTLGPNVRISGLRIQGPNPKRQIEHHRRSFGKGGGGHKAYYKFPTQNGIVTEHDGLTVDNCDISGFGHAGIYLNKGRGHSIHHNHIHHCQYQGLGYGISHNTASSVIEYNLFNWNRHSIAGTGRPGCTYVARHNVELGVSLSHCFDMHGGRDRGDGTDIAGTAITIENNTFRAPQTPIVIRGVPQETCTVTRNWFPRHPTPEKAVRAAASTRVWDNAYGEDALVK